MTTSAHPDRHQVPRAGPAARMDAARDALACDSRRGGGGRFALEQYADRLDAALRALLAAASPPALPFALIALGQYGRRWLGLHSAADILLLIGRSGSHEADRFAGDLIHSLHEVSLPVVPRVRALADFESPDCANPEVLALLDARLVHGDGLLLDEITSAFETPETQQALLDTIRRLVAERHSRLDDTVYQLEPDVNDAPGGLEDLVAARHIARLRSGADLGQGPAAMGALEAAEEFLLRVRSILQVSTGRDRTVLTHQLQEQTAQLLGTKGVRTQQRVERLMGAYFRHARTVFQALSWTSRRATPFAVVEPVVLTDNIRRGPEGLDFVDPERGAVEPTTWLPLFALALEHDTPVSDRTLASIRRHAEHYEPGRFYLMPEDRRRVVDLLRPRRGLYGWLSQLHDCELLGCMFPEFRGITGRMIRDFHHKYTVDEHALLAIRAIERLARADTFDARLKRFEGVLREVAAPELLVLSLLLHDVGKWRDGNHLLESVRLTKAALGRLDVDPHARGTVEFLVAHHLDMSTIAFRRDSEDPHVVKRFAALVGKVDRLNMLCLLTYADMAAVNPHTLTPWKEDLLWRLYEETYRELTLGDADRVIDRNASEVAELLAMLPGDVTKEEVVDFVEGMPRRYLHVFDAVTIYEHVRLGRNIGHDDVHVSLTPKQGTWVLTVVTLDKAYLFTRLCGALSLFGMDILRGHVLTSAKGLVADSFQFADPKGFFDAADERRGQFCEVVSEIVSGRRHIDVSPDSDGTALRSLIEPVVRVDNHASLRHTVLEIVAADRVGLLHTISHALSQHACSVDLVLISTEGEKAVDVFHISKNGDKLTLEEHTALAEALLRLLRHHGP